VWQNIRSRTDLEKYKIQVLGKGDQIQLSGETTSEQTRALIESVARATPGVTAVENAIIVRRS
jgi:osmotically-inducible protein OsmY